MPEWTLWAIPCLFTLVFAQFIIGQVLRTRRPLAAEQVCPSSHRDAVSVEDVDGELVAWLCLDLHCGKQLPKDWRPCSPEQGPDGED